MRSLIRIGLLAAAPGLLSAATLEQTTARMDQAAASFRAMKAKVRNVAHTAVINEDSIDIGTMALKRTKKQIMMLVNLTEPDPKSVAFQGRKVELYYPKIQTVQEYDVGKNHDLVEQFLLLGWGSSAREMSAGYRMKLVGEEKVSGQETSRLELTPKSAEMLKHLKKVELWVGANGYPIQQKFHFPAGDYRLVTYSDLKINPDLPDSAVRLNLPRGVKREFPQK